MAAADPPEHAASYRRILVSTFVIGGASVVSLVIGLVRTKFVAVLLGPAGIGLIGLYAGLLATAGAVASLGLATVGTRDIAEAHAGGDARRLAVARWALFTASVGLALTGGLAVWLLRAPLAELATGDRANASAVGWLAPGVALSVLAASQSALVRGMQRMADLAWITILGALVATLVGVPLLWLLGEAGIALFVVLGPLSAWLTGLWFVARIPPPVRVKPTLAELRPHWGAQLRLGVPFMAAGVVSTAVEFWMRVDVHRQLGVDALGQFQASWIISAQCVGFVLSAMAADYFPRLSAAMKSPAEAVAIINQQTEVALLLAGPVILAMIGLAPAVLQLLYTDEFAPAADMLRWQALATGLKVAAWTLGFVMLAAGDGRTFFVAEASTLLVMALLLHFLLQPLGVTAGGVAYLGGYLFLVPLTFAIARRRLGFRPTRHVVSRTLALALALALALFLLTSTAPAAAWPATAACAVLFAGYARMRFGEMGLDLTGRFMAPLQRTWRGKQIPEQNG